MHRRKLHELNLLDDFFFNTMLNYPEIGEEFSRQLLKIIFRKNFGKLQVIAQKVYYGTDTDKHGARLDVYLEEEDADSALLNVSTIYDIEPNLLDDTEMITSLPKRVRFYHAKIDSNSLKASESYRVLKNVIVIMITPYDPFGLGRMVYTIRNKCEEDANMEYDDGARTIFLYTKGTKGNPPEELMQLLRYMEHTIPENATNDDLRYIQNMVDTVKKSEEVSSAYMKIFEREEYLINKAIQKEKAIIEQERKRADDAEARASDAETRASEMAAEILRLKQELLCLQQAQKQ